MNNPTPTFFLVSDAEMILTMLEELGSVQPDYKLIEKIQEYWRSRGIEIK